MSPPDAPNPERRSNVAMICFCLGLGLCILAYMLGIGAVIGAAMSGGDPAIVVGSIFAAFGIAMLGLLGVILVVVGGIWMIAQVVADQSGNAEEKRYRDIER
jgi:drug/metabolite transporter (DMT)-like permease